MKVGILGTAPSFHQAPFQDLSWQLWCCNVGTVPRWDRWFDLHDDASIDTYPGHREFLTSQTKPVFTRKNYPIASMKAKFGDWFFTSTIAYMLAMAIAEGAHEIGLWGVEMADATEYGSQKTGCRFFIQAARMAGIKVTMPEGCEVAVPGRLYVLDPPSWIERKATVRRDELMGRMRQNDGLKQTLILEKTALEGRKKITLTDEQIDRRLSQIGDELEKAERDGLVLDGALQDITYIWKNWSGAEP